MQNREPGFEARPGNNIQDGINPLVRAECSAEALHDVLRIAIGAAQADFGTVQHYDSTEDCLKVAASYGFPDQALSLFQIVRRDTNSTCAATLKQRMRTIVGILPPATCLLARASWQRYNEQASQRRIRRL